MMPDTPSTGRPAVVSEEPDGVCRISRPLTGVDRLGVAFCGRVDSSVLPALVTVDLAGLQSGAVTVPLARVSHG